MVSIYNLFAQSLSGEVYIYGFDVQSKKLLMILINCNIYVSGFVVEERLFSGEFHYIGKRLYTREEFERETDRSKATLLAWNEKTIEEIKNQQTLKLVPFLSSDKTFVIYGAGMMGKKALELINEFGGNVIGFCDRDIKKQQDGYLGYKVYCIEDVLEQKDCEITPIVAIYQNDENQKICSKFKSEGIDSYSYSEREENFSTSIIFDDKYPGGDTEFLYYLYEKSKTRKIVLLGIHSDILLDAADKFSLAGLEIYRIACFDKEDINDNHGNKFIDAFDLIDEKIDDSIFVTIAYEDEDIDKINTFIRVSGIDERIVIRQRQGPNRLYHMFYLDVNLGYCLGNHDTVLQTRNRIKHSRIAIIGGSASDIHAFTEKSWPEYLVEVMDEHNIAADILCGAVAGYTVSQEIIKFLRDIYIQFKPDIVISYSFYNELSGVYADNHPFVHDYQKKIFTIFEKANRRTSYADTEIKNKLNLGEEQKDIIGHWISIEDAMHSICKAQGIKFYSFIQPALPVKTNKSEADIEALEHVLPNNRNRFADISKNYNLLQIQANDIAWMYDVSGYISNRKARTFYDLCHLFEEANKDVANYVFEQLKESIDDK